MLIKEIIKALISNDSFITIRSRSKLLKTTYRSSVNRDYNDFAILIQGPEVRENRFTIETLKLYRFHFPSVNIIWSTWVDALSDEAIDICQDLDINLCLKERKGPDLGYGSTNMQLESCKNGLKFIAEKNITYTFKTRSDQRYYNKSILGFLESIHKDYNLIYPVNKASRQRGRIITMSFDSFLYRLYGLSDMMHFGYTEDVYKYWDSDYDTRQFVDSELIQKSQINQMEYSKLRLCEVYLMTEFLKRVGFQIEWDLNSYWQAVRERFIIVDSSSLDFYWPKYTNYEERWKMVNSFFL